MKRNAKQTNGINREHGLPPEYLSLSKISRKTAFEILQHPAVLLPLAICILLLIYLLLLSPIFGGRPAVIILAVIAGVTGAYSFYTRYFRKYPGIVREQIQALKAEETRIEESELSQRYRTLEDGFSGIESTKGLKALTDLSREYAQLKAFLGQPRLTDSLSTPLIGSLAGETYRQGLAVLSDAFELMTAVQASERVDLERDISELEKSIAMAGINDKPDEKLALLKETLKSRHQRLQFVGEIEIGVERLLHEAGRCEFALSTARIELAALRASSSKTSVDNLTGALERTIRRVKEVQNELSKIGY